LDLLITKKDSWKKSYPGAMYKKTQWFSYGKKKYLKKEKDKKIKEKEIEIDNINFAKNSKEINS